MLPINFLDEIKHCKRKFVKIKREANQQVHFTVKCSIVPKIYDPSGQHKK